MSNLDVLINNIEDVYSHLIFQYNSNTYRVDNRILLEQIWVLRRITIENTAVNNEFKNKLEDFYILLKNKVFNDEPCSKEPYKGIYIH